MAEHIRPDAAEHFVEICTRHSDRILFTAAHPNQGGLGHLNEQPIEYWIAKFDARGFALDSAATKELRPLKPDLPENLLIFARK